MEGIHFRNSGMKQSETLILYVIGFPSLIWYAVWTASYYVLNWIANPAGTQRWNNVNSIFDVESKLNRCCFYVVCLLGTHGSYLLYWWCNCTPSSICPCNLYMYVHVCTWTPSSIYIESTWPSNSHDVCVYYIRIKYILLWLI